MAKIDVTVVVNGEPTEVEVNENAPLTALVGKALVKTTNTGQAPENWELRDGQGNELDLDKKFASFGFAEGVKLFLNLKAGIGGGH